MLKPGKIRIQTSDSFEMTANNVTFDIGLSAYHKDAVEIMNIIYERYDSILSKLEDVVNKSGDKTKVKIHKSTISINKHFIKEEKNGKTQLKENGYDAFGNISITYKLDSVEIDYNAIYSLVTVSDKDVSVTINYRFGYTDTYVRDSKRSLRENLLDKAEKTALDIVGGDMELIAKKIVYDGDSGRETSYGMRMAMSEDRSQQTKDTVIMNTAELAKKFIENKDTRPTTKIHDAIRVYFKYH